MIGVPLVVRLLCLLELHDAPLFRLLVVDARTYHDTAVRIASGADGSAEPFWQPPLYPWFLSLIYRLGSPEPNLARGVQALLGALSCLLVFRLGERVFDRRAAWIAWGIAAFSGPLIFFDLQLLGASLAIFLVLFALERITAARGCMSRVVSAGALLGLASITVATLLSLVPVVAAWIALRRDPAPATGRVSTPRGRALLFLVAALLPVLSVGARNLAVSGEPVLISYNGGINFWIGNNPDSEASVRTRPGREWIALVNRPVEAGVEGAAASSNWWYRQSFAWIQSRPGDWLRLLARKARAFVGGTELARNQEIYPFRNDSAVLRALLWVRGIAFPFGVLLPIAGAGAFALFRRRSALDSRSERAEGAGLLVAVVAVLSATVILFFVTSRYRLPVVPLLALFAGGGISRWIDAFRSGERSSVIAPAVVALVLGVVANAGLPHPPSQFNSDAWSDLGTAHAEEGRFEDAARAFRTALDLNPSNLEAAQNLGGILIRAGRPLEAEPLFRRVLAAYPEDRNALLNLGTVAYYQGDLYRAGELYERVVRLDPRHVLARENLRGLEVQLERHEREQIDADEDGFLARLQSRLAEEPGNAFLSRRLSALRAREGR